MANLELKGILDFRGLLTLQGAGGGKVVAGGKEVLVEQAEATAPLGVMQPPPPALPLDPGTKVKIIASLNKTVKAKDKPIVTQGMVLQGNTPTWPGMVLRGAGTVTVNQIPMNVQNEQAVIFPSGGSAVFSQSGQ